MLLSRVADALYWISRYLERAEHTARLVDVAVDLGLDRARPRCEAPRDRAALRQPRPAGRRCRRSELSLARARALRPVEPQLGGGLRHRRARERAPGARGDQLRHVGADQRAVPARQADSQRRVWAGRTHYVSRVDHRRRAPLRRASPTRRWATARAGSTCRPAASSSAPASTATLLDAFLVDEEWLPAAVRRRSIRRTGWRCCGRARRSKGTAATTRRTCGRNASPSSCCSTRSSRVRSASRPRELEDALARASRGTPDGRAAAAPSGCPAGCARRSTTPRWTRSLATDPHAYLAGVSRQCAQIHSAVLPELRRPDRVRTAGVAAPCQAASRIHRNLHAIHRPPRHPLHLRDADHRERDGGAHAAAQRRRAALPALRADDDARRRA